MKKIFFIIILLLTAVLVMDSIKYLNNYNDLVQLAEKYQQDGHEIGNPHHMDVFTKQMDYFRDGYSVIIQFVYPLLLIVSGCFIFHNKIHSGFFKNVIVREKFEKFINNEIFKSWSVSFLIPILMIIAFIFSCFVTHFNFDLTSNNSSEMFLDNVVNKTIFSEITIILLMTFNLFIVSIACINVGLIFVKKNKNFVISSVIAYLFIIIYQIVVAVIVGPILSDIFKSTFFANGLTLFSFWYYDSGVNFLNMFIYGMTLLLITTCILRFVYKDKENVIINAEK